MPQVPIQTLVPGAAPIELAAYYDEFLWYYADCEPVTKHWYVRNVRPDWVMFDVGANIGYYTILFSRLAANGMVHAFEPTSTVEMLRANLAHNGCANVQVHQLALGSQSGQVEDNIYRIWGEKAERQAYPFARLDDFVAQHAITRLDCLKIDVDSFDFDVLLGAENTIRTLKPTIVVELNHSLSLRNQSNMQALEWLRSLGLTEVLCLDGDNFVVQPLGAATDSYPVKSEITVKFADISGLPAFGDGSALTVVKAIDLKEDAEVQHGAFDAAGGVAEITTLAQKWANATGFRLGDLTPLAGSSLWVEADIEVVSGRVGVGILNSPVEYQGQEHFLDAGSRQTVLMPVTEPAAVTSLMLRNGDEAGAASVVRLFRVSVGRL